MSLSRLTQLVALGAIAWGLAQACPGETSDHERLGVLRPQALVLSWGLDYEAWSRTGGGLESVLALGLGARWSSLNGLELGLPVSILANKAEVKVRILAPRLDLSLGQSLGPWRLGLVLGGRLPGLAGAAGGEELGRIDLSLQAQRFSDPLVLGLGLGGGSLIPGKGGYGGADRPLDLSLGLSATEALNERVSASLELGQSLAFPALGSPRPRSWTYAISMGLRILILIGDGGLSFGLSDPSRPHFMASAFGELVKTRISEGIGP